MKLVYALFLCLFLNPLWTLSQKPVVINELDCDTPGIDDKEFVELRSAQPNFNLDGYVLVFFNGSANGGNTSYLALDLDGYTTDVNGILLIGSKKVVPFPQYLISENLIQNGADAVAMYKADAFQFPEGTLAYVDTTLVDVLLYDTNDADAEGLLSIFRAFNPAIEQINEGNTNNTNSVQRNNDGTYFSGTPTPRRLNDGSGIILNGVLTAFNQEMYNEGDTVKLVFTTEQVVESDLIISFSLGNATFNNVDFSGSTEIVLPKGQNTVDAEIILIDDAFDEGDEIMIMQVMPLPVQFLALNNNVSVRIVDNDYRVADYGTPIKPTYGRVKATYPSDYYQSISGLTGQDLRNGLQAVIANPDVIRIHTYNDVTDILKEADQNPENSNQVWLVYLEKGRPKLDFQISSDNVNSWNREHTWPRSRGDFNSINADDTVDGKEIFWHSNADSTRHANSDAHAIRAEDGPENSSRGNQFYGQYRGPAGTLGGFKGDVARGIFYLDVRYNGLELVKGYPEGLVGKFGDLDTLLAWHRNDPPDDFEMNRNNVVYDWQQNRNPFIDHPELVDYFWGNKTNDIWLNPSKTGDTEITPFTVFPNPNSGKFYITGIDKQTTIELMTIEGKSLTKHTSETDMTVDLPLHPGLYLLKFTVQNKIFTEKLLVE